MESQQKSTTFTYKKEKEVKKLKIFNSKNIITQKNREFVDTMTKQRKEKRY